MFVSEIIEDVIEVLGRCDRAKAYKRLTDAIQALQDEGDWNANLGYIDIRPCVSGNLGRTISLPPEIETPLAVAVNCRPVFMRDEFYQFHLNGDGVEMNGVPWAWDDRGNYPTFMDIVCPSEVVAVARRPSDAGVLVRILGTGSDGNTLRTQLEDGTWIDGLTVVANAISDFPGGIISAPGARVFQRLFVPNSMTTLSSVTPHNLVTGALMQVLFDSGASANPIVNRSLYYIRAVDTTRISLHSSRLDARTGQSPIVITQLGSSYTLTLSDSRSVEARTRFLAASSLSIENLSSIVFEASTLPEGLAERTPYWIQKTDDSSFMVFNSLELAEANRTPINALTAGTGVVARSLYPLNPSTTLTFSVNHNYSTGDSITARNAGGQLPAPLSAGVAYYVRRVDALTITLHTSLSDALAGNKPIVLTSEGSGTNSLVKLIPATVVTGSSSNVSAPGHGLDQPTGTGATATATVATGAVTGFTVTNGGSGYVEPPIVRITGGAGSGAQGTAIVTGGVLTSITLDTGGTGYTSAPTVTLVAASGSFVQFTTTGTLPEPITQASVYRSESPMTTGTFTLTSADGRTPINITSLGAGSLFLNVSRAFGVGFNSRWSMETTGFSTGAAVRLFNQIGALPIASPSIDQSATYYLRVISPSVVELYSTEAQALDTASTSGRISITALGSGELFATSDISVDVVPRDSFMDLEFSGYLANFSKIRFSTDGTLPSPLNSSTDYLASIDSDGMFSVLDVDGTPVTLSDIGSGSHDVVISRAMTVDPATSLYVPAHQFNDGDAVTVISSGVLPSPLSTSSTYYVRSIGIDHVELYAQSSQSLNAPSVTGRLLFTDVGSGTHKTVQELPAILVQSVSNIEKPLTSDFVALYAFDDGNPDALSLLADMHPNTTNPIYRRIRVGSDCANVRMKYRRRSAKITSDRDFINLDSAMAVTMMVKSQDLLRKNFFDESERYRTTAIAYLNKRNRAIDGPRTPTLQINADVTTVPDDVMID